MAKANIADIFKGLPVSNSDTSGREQIVYIERGAISGDDDNFYSIEGVEELAANIELIGLQQPIRVRPDPTDEGGYLIVSGHRRFTAIIMLAKEDPKRWETVPCIIDDHPEESDAMRELRLIYANSDTRKMSSADISKQAERVEALLYQLKEEGVEFPGRMRDHVAEACKVSTSKLARLKVIREGLSPNYFIQGEWQLGKLSEATAYALAKLPVDLQDEIAEAYKEHSQVPAHGLKYLYENTVERIGEDIKKLESMTCDVNNAPCQECATHKRRKIISQKINYGYSATHCHQYCCEDCPDLDSCKDVCPLLKSRQEKLKLDKRAAKKAEREKVAAENAPKIEQLKDIWSRFATCREAAGVSIEDFRRETDTRYWGLNFEACERGEKITADGQTPYGFYRYEVDRIVSAANLLGVSIDYLLCRSSMPQSADDVAQQPAAQLMIGGWMPGGTNPAHPCDCVVIFDLGNGDTFRQICHWDGERFRFSKRKTGSVGETIELQPIKWMELPPEEVDDNA
ncbi:MAG: ParB N-terminal domain-containing protein [Eubacteriales bacterium]|nr:ParB N-terminal domain-containing protein [Eubacteriales bacterium]